MTEEIIFENGTWFLVTRDADGNILSKVPGTFKASPQVEPNILGKKQSDAE